MTEQLSLFSFQGAWTPLPPASEPGEEQEDTYCLEWSLSRFSGGRWSTTGLGCMVRSGDLGDGRLRFCSGTWVGI